ncbi:hypothetical protein [Microcoleus asticus]|nr:hypothetical protein [Microcoleus asticus]
MLTKTTAESTVSHARVDRQPYRLDRSYLKSVDFATVAKLEMRCKGCR